jgi:hypothetical protein
VFVDEAQCEGAALILSRRLLASVLRLLRTRTEIRDGLVVLVRCGWEHFGG